MIKEDVWSIPHVYTVDELKGGQFEVLSSTHVFLQQLLDTGSTGPREPEGVFVFIPVGCWRRSRVHTDQDAAQEGESLPPKSHLEPTHAALLLSHNTVTCANTYNANRQFSL